MALRKMELHNLLTGRLGAPSDAAEEVCNLIEQQTDGLVTETTFRNEMEAFRLELLNEIQARLNSHLRWMITMWGSVIAAIVALAVAIIVRGG